MDYIKIQITALIAFWVGMLMMTWLYKMCTKGRLDDSTDYNKVEEPTNETEI